MQQETGVTDSKQGGLLGIRAKGNTGKTPATKGRQIARF